MQIISFKETLKPTDMKNKTFRAHVQAVPATTPFEDHLYLSGTFNETVFSFTPVRTVYKIFIL